MKVIKTEANYKKTLLYKIFTISVINDMRINDMLKKTHH